MPVIFHSRSERVIKKAIAKRGSQKRQRKKKQARPPMISNIPPSIRGKKKVVKGGMGIDDGSCRAH
jgi:hypothetical protein